MIMQVSLATFATYALVHQHSEDPEDRLTADKVFVALSLFNIIRFPLSMLPMLIMFMVQVCYHRCSSTTAFVIYSVILSFRLVCL